MAKKIYGIRYWCRRFHIGIVDVVKETKKLYYVEEISLALEYKKALKKAEEGLNWTTDKAKFPEIQQNYVNKVINAQKNKIIEAQDDLARLIEDAKRLGLKVEE